VALTVAQACSDKMVMPAKYLNALRRAGSKCANGQWLTEEYPACFPKVVKLSLDAILKSQDANTEDARKETQQSCSPQHCHHPALPAHQQGVRAVNLL